MPVLTIVPRRTLPPYGQYSSYQNTMTIRSNVHQEQCTVTPHFRTGPLLPPSPPSGMSVSLHQSRRNEMHLSCHQAFREIMLVVFEVLGLRMEMLFCCARQSLRAGGKSWQPMTVGSIFDGIGFSAGKETFHGFSFRPDHRKHRNGTSALNTRNRITKQSSILVFTIYIFIDGSIDAHLYSGKQRIHFGSK